MGKRLPAVKFKFDRTTEFSGLANQCTDWIIGLAEVRESLLPLALALFGDFNNQPPEISTEGGFIGSVANPEDGKGNLNFATPRLTLSVNFGLDPLWGEDGEVGKRMHQRFMNLLIDFFLVHGAVTVLRSVAMVAGAYENLAPVIDDFQREFEEYEVPDELKLIALRPKARQGELVEQAWEDEYG